MPLKTGLFNDMLTILNRGFLPFWILEPVIWISFKEGEYQSGQLGQTVNLLSYDFIGSNPISPTGHLLIGDLLIG